MRIAHLLTLTVALGLASQLQAAPLGSQAGNLLNNGSVESGTFDPISGHGVPSAADNWRQWSNSGTLLTSELISSSEMQSFYGTDVVDGNAALRLTTNGAGDGGFTFNFDHVPGWDPYAELTISAWVFVLSGEMALFLGANSPGNFTWSASSTVGQWEYLELTRSAGQLNNEPLLYSINGAADFIVDAIWLNYGSTSTTTAISPVPVPATLLLLLTGLFSLQQRAKR